MTAKLDLYSPQDPPADANPQPVPEGEPISVAGCCVHQLFAERAQCVPDALAVSDGASRLSYAELDALSNQVARHLMARGVGCESLVGLSADRTTAMIVGLLGIIKAGAAFVPLDPDYPDARLAHAIGDAELDWVVAGAGSACRWQELVFTVLALDEACSAVSNESAEPPDAAMFGANLAYVLHTSGSTGRPKGVMVEHRSLVNLWRGLESAVYRDLTGPLNLSVNASLSFDASAQQWLGLLSGHALHLVPSAIRADGAALGAWIRDTRIDVLDCVPSQLRLLIDEGFLEGDGWLPAAILPGGEAIDTATWETLVATERVSFFNMYGPTECTVDATTCLVSDRAHKPSIGRPLANQTAYILDDRLDPVPESQVGELYIGGAGVSRGYLNKPGMTAEVFLPDPFADAPGSRMYRTGDLARFLPDDNIEYLGRRDNQIKIRGHRIELGEIESVLRQVTGANCVASAWTGPGSGELVAHIVAPAQTLSAGELRAACAESLPEFMVPSRYYCVEALPLTPNGKLDRKALLGLGDELREPIVAPRTETEERLAEIWTELLGRERVGVDENFFHIGGHSLMATQLVARVTNTLHASIPVAAVFQAPTIAEMARLVEEARGVSQDDAVFLRPTSDRLPPASYAQERLWFLDQLEGIGAAYNVPSAYRLEGELDIAALQKALDEIVRRHQALRTVFRSEDGVPRQMILPPYQVSLRQVDLSALDGAAQDEAIAQHVGEILAPQFDLANGPLQNVTLVRLAETQYVLLITTHHIASDGWSEGVMRRELGALYSAYAKGRPSPLDPLPMQYADYAAWQRDYLRGDVLDEQLGYWRRQLRDLPTLRLPTDKPRPARQTFRGGTHLCALGLDVGNDLQALARSEGATFYMTLLAGYMALLAATTGQRDVAVGTPTAGRVRQEFEGLIGFFVNTLAMRARVSPGQTFRELLCQVRDMAHGAFAHQDLPFEWIVRDLKCKRDASRNPLVQVTFVLQNASDDELLLDGLSATRMPLDEGTSRFDLENAIYMRGDRIELETIYNADLFERDTIERLAARYLDLLSAAAQDPDLPLRQIQAFGEDERLMPSDAWNDTRTGYPREASVYGLFHERAAATPDAVAVICGDDSLTYRELDERASQLAHYLRERGVGQESLVGVAMPRSLDSIVALLGILGAGGAYVPLDPGYPPARLAFMLADAQPDLILTQSALEETFADAGVPVVSMDKAREEMARQPSESPVCPATGDNLAYVMYTSGTTGRPKGVAVPQRAIVRLVRATDYVALDDVVCLHMAPLAFDASTFEIWAPLLNGGRLVMCDRDAPSLRDVVRAIHAHGVNTLWLTAGLFHVMVQEHLDDLGPLRQLLAGGDVVPVEDVQRVRERWPHIRMIDGYGPTENTTFSVCYTVDRADAHAAIPIGRPIANSRAYILDERLDPVPVGATGELYVAGDGLARGYHNLPGLTAERFLPDPFAPEPGSRMYRTGDLARYLPDGVIEFLGRRDNQIKLRGFRIELGEIEAALRRHPSVADAVVLAPQDDRGTRRLAAYLVPGSATACDEADVRGYLADELPGHMVPDTFVSLDALPLTPNGKVDRRALPEPAFETGPGRDYAEPRTPNERRVAEIWAALLGIERVGIHDSFFELGGHSLLATQAVARIQKALGIELPVSRMFHQPTIAALMEDLAVGRADKAALPRPPRDDSSSLVPIRDHGAGQPLFCIHPLGAGAVLVYLRLSDALGADRPVYGLQPRGLDGSQSLQCTIEEMAEHYVEQMRSVRPRGPYAIVGHSAGGMIAYEMARLVRRQGERVNLLAIIDTDAYLAPMNDRALSAGLVIKRRLELAGLRIGQHVSALKSLPWRQRPGYVAERIRRMVSGVHQEAETPSITDPDEAMWYAINRYVPQPYAGRITVIKAQDGPSSVSGDTSLGWATLAEGGVDVHLVPGDHITIMQEPNVQVIADLLNDYLSGN